MSEPLTVEECQRYVGRRVRIELNRSGIYWNTHFVRDTLKPTGFILKFNYCIYLHAGGPGYSRENWFLNSSQISEQDLKIYLIEDLPDWNNKGQKKCILCTCATEKRRDFSDFSIREFCPRCKR